MNGMITTNADFDLAEVLPKLKAYTDGKGGGEGDLPAEIRRVPGDGFHVALMDFGTKKNIAEKPEQAAAVEVTVYPALTTAEEILADAARTASCFPTARETRRSVRSIIAEIQKLYASEVPIFAICLGHQLMALATGGGHP